jgi:hypothetical protein
MAKVAKEMSVRTTEAMMKPLGLERMSKTLVGDDAFGGDFGEHAGIDEPVENHAGDDQGAEQEDRIPIMRVTAKPLTRTAGEGEQDAGGDEGGDVGVEDGGEGLVEGGLKRGGEGFAIEHFFAQTFVDEHVGIHSHTDGEHDTGDAGHGQSELEQGHGAEQEGHVDDKTDHSDEAGPAVDKGS